MAHRTTERAASSRSLFLWLSVAAAAVTFVVVGVWVSSLSSRSSQQLDGDVDGAASIDEATLPTQHGPSWQETDNPSRDGWDTEVFSAKATQVLNRLGKMLTDPSGIRPDQLAPLVSGDFSCGRLVPESLEAVISDHLFEVRRGEVEQTTIERQTIAANQGAEGLALALQQLVEPFQGAKDLHFKFKLFRLAPAGNSVTTRLYFAFSGRTPRGMRELHSTWVCRWQIDSKNQPPRLSWIGVEDYEEVVLRLGSRPLFVDCTESVLGANDCYRRQFLRGMNHWCQRIQDQRYMAVMGTIGLVVGDANGDGLDDLFVCQAMGLPNRLFLQQADGTLHDVSADWGVDWLENTRSALLVDLDQDGDQDLVVAMVGNLVLASNEGEGFEVRVVLPTDDDTMSLSAVDYDDDGDLDLHACVYFQNDEMEKPRAVVLGGVGVGAGADNNGAGRNALFRNEIAAQGWRFSNVTNEVGLDARHHSFAAAWEDFDNDGDQDLYVANDYGDNNLYRNDGGKFTDITESAAAADDAQGMSAAWGDYDQDGWMDMYVSNMFSAAGSRVTHLERFRSDAPEVRPRYQRWARGNTLLRNLGDGMFGDVSEVAAVTMGRWAWGSNFVDINNDGREDLIVANGYLTTEESGDL